MSNAKLIYDGETKIAHCLGLWNIANLANLTFPKIPTKCAVTLDGSQLENFDSAGALALYNHTKGLQLTYNGFKKEHLKLLESLDTKAINYDQAPPKKPNILARIGQEAILKTKQADGLIVLIGDLCLEVTKTKRIKIKSVVSVIFSAGIQALPILALLSFLIGVVLAYQMGLQLEMYGANNFIALLSGMANLREFAPLITAIIVAGRTSSAFTAQLGSMKINEEIDALKTMGLSVTRLLVLPKVLGLLIVFPLLIFWSDVFSLLGSMFMAKHLLGVNFVDFLTRLKDSVGIEQFLLGLYKAPVFALLIAIVGCFQGFSVESNAQSVGFHTTKSVVQALFLIIIADAIYSIIYSWIGI